VCPVMSMCVFKSSQTGEYVYCIIVNTHYEDHKVDCKCFKRTVLLHRCTLADKDLQHHAGS
jgi:hypothetical protein